MGEKMEAPGVLQGVVLRGGQGSAVHVAIFSSTGDLVHVI